MLIQPAFKVFKEQRIHSISEPSAPMLHQPQSENALPDLQPKCLLLQLGPLCLVPSPAAILFITTLLVFEDGFRSVFKRPF